MSIKLLDLEPQRRDAILNAALKEFALKGFDNASTNVIAKEAGISKALMFHYVNSKQELFQFVYDYFTELLNKEYFMKMDFKETDLFERLRQSYILQIELLKQYPWIFEFSKLSATTNSAEVDKELQNRVDKKQLSCDNKIFDMIDFSKFKAGLNVDKCKQFILWANVGFTNEIIDDIRNSQTSNLDYQHIIATLDEYFDELRKVFYRSSNN
ncbi:TetR/AcrR family transcriptional regulator [Anaerocolumna aminovalerica]|uniref:Regulatory protein, tetR family n=1 Tax=Anaerocolumna aminovalerica TaxID=1527 RepID=A0A1I5FPB1_9FIRM|nr:TetR/AcrR family transcriptional regulator [Anaerocolumna aminovalerica]MBU5331595.1 TetR/AcrR family transcriptional regulator [Anaerocolumna aminovalerica]MDU6265317.1 TetR/AcrR family transcriptional regulator [Anaerocolumna aminovalerica]SFO25582.1 regulatory protein, tetR family [Anaerocolumna aminovalerica]